MNTTHVWDNQIRTKGQNKCYSLETQLNTTLEAHKCGLGTLTREALGTIGSGPNNSDNSSPLIVFYLLFMKEALSMCRA